MKVSNIDLDQLLALLTTIKEQGNVMVDIELIGKNENNNNDRITIYPIKLSENNSNTDPSAAIPEQAIEQRESDITIFDDNINIDDDSIYNMFDNVS